MSNILVINYSRHGNTRRLAHEIAEGLSADVDEIRDLEKRSGIGRYLISGLEALAKGLPTIRLDSNPGEYEVVVLGTPVWVGTMASPMRSFLFAHGDELKKVACFCTMKASGAGSTLREMSELCGSPLAPTLSATCTAIGQGKHRDALEDFLDQVQGLVGRAVPAVA